MIDEMMDDALSMLVESAKDQLKNSVSESLPKLRNMLSKALEMAKLNIVVEDVDSLTLKKLVEIASVHKVKDSTEVAAFKTATEEEYIIYLAYTCNRELIEKNNNKYIIIRSQSLARNVETLFNNDQLILLQ